MLTQPQQCFDARCPLAGVAQGWVPDEGDPATAKLVICLEAPYKDEIFWKQDDAEEIARRRAAFPDVPLEFLQRGGVTRGASGDELFGWALAPFGLTRKDVFLMNTLRCCMNLKEPQYPIGEVRKRAEAACRQWDRKELQDVNLGLVSIHPAALHRDPAPLPMQLKSFEKALDFTRRGYKVIVLAGGKAANWWFGAARNPTRWLLHFEFNDIAAKARREQRRLKGLEVVVGKKEKKPKKLTARTALALVLARLGGFDGSVVVSQAEYDEMLALTQLKKKLANNEIS